MEKRTGSCNCREALALCPACREQALCDKYEEIKTMARPGNVSKMETTLTAIAAKMIERFQLSPKESVNIETYLRTVEREALERAAQICMNHYDMESNCREAAHELRLLAKSGETRP